MTRLFPGVFYGWVMVGASLAINMAVSPLNAVVFSFLIGPMSDDLGVQKSALAWALTLRLVTAGLSGPVIGILLDRLGSRWLGATCGAIGGISLVALGAVDSLWAVYALFVLSGFAGFGGPAGHLLTQVPLARWFVAKRGRALAIATTGLAAGTVITVPVTQLLVEAIGWRGTTIVFGVMIVGVVVPMSSLFMRRSPEDMGLHPDGAESAQAVIDASSVETQATRLATRRDWTVREAVGTSAMWLILAALTVQGVVLTGTLVYRVDFWQSTGMAPALVGFGTALDPLCVVFSILAFGVIADRIPIRYLGFIGVAGMGLSMVPMIVSNGQTWTILAHNAIWGISAGGWITLNSLVWPNYFGRMHLGAIRGIVLPVSIAAASAGAPLFGYLLDSGMAPSRLWTLGLLLFASSSVLVLLARPPRPPRESGDQPAGALPVREPSRSAA